MEKSKYIWIYEIAITTIKGLSNMNELELWNSVASAAASHNDIKIAYLLGRINSFTSNYIYENITH